MGVYLLHFDKPLSHAGHYIGFVQDDASLDERLAAHMAGRGARIIEVCFEREIEWQAVRFWFGADRNFERRLKKNWHGRRICPICAGPNAMRYMNNYPNTQLTRGR